MLTYYKTSGNTIQPTSGIEPNTWISIVAPTEDELKNITAAFPEAEDYLIDPLDLDEKSRVERDEGLVFVLLRIPHFTGLKEEMPFSTIPLGIIITRENIFTICKEDNVILEEMENGRVKDINTAKRFRLLLQIMMKTATKYLTHLREINKKVDALEDHLQASMRNEELLELVKYQKILVFYTTALKSNELMLERLQRSGLFTTFSDDADLLDDVMIEFQQAIEMTNISNNILTQMMGAYASIINNNMNIVIKFLTLITITIAIPTLIASLYGMNVDLPGKNSPAAFWFIIGACLLSAGSIIAVFYKRRWF